MPAANGYGLPARQGLYDPRFEHDACGIGFVTHVEGKRSHRVLQMGLEALCNHAHRGAVADDRKTGDGAGILTQLPHEFFNRELQQNNMATVAPADLAVGQLFLHRQDGEDRARARAVIREVLEELKLEVLTFRSVPVIENALGLRAEQSRPWMGQVILRRTEEACEAGDDFERLLYVARKQIAHRAQAAGVQRLYVSSLSSRTIVYKGLVLAEKLAYFYPDLSDPDFKTAIAVFHQRYSTNTFPTWERAQPFRLLCHNGEINTLQGNVNWFMARKPDLASPYWADVSAALTPIIGPDGSDSAKLDNVMELLVRSGRDVRHVAMMMIPEAWERMPEGEMTPERRAFYEYHSALMEPWDGPAAVTYTDGRIVGTLLDRNGLRPARYVVLDNGYVITASEAGAVRYDEERVIRKGRIGPGQIFCVDTTRGLIMNDEEITQYFASRRPYDRWVKKNLVRLDDLTADGVAEAPGVVITEHPPANGANGTNGVNGRNGHVETPRIPAPLSNRQAAFGYTREESIVVLRPMIADAKEPVGAMGDDTPPPGMSKLPRPLFNYFKQRFAEVTNPPIDPLREELVMSLRVLLGKRANLLAEEAEATRLIELKSPVLLPEQLYALRTMPEPEFRSATIDATWPLPGVNELDGPAAGAVLRAAVERLCLAAEEAVRDGVRTLIISDARADRHTLSIPSLLATGAVHHHLIRQGIRMHASLVLESGEPREVHHVAALVGYGANAVCPYLIFESITELVDEDRKLNHLSPKQGHDNFVKAVNKGLFKIMSKMGISTVDSYCGAQIFESLGIGTELLDVAFTGTPGILGGVGFESLAEDVLAWHAAGYPRSYEDGRAVEAVKLGTWGLYKSRRGGELHEWSPQVVHALTAAVRAETDEQAKLEYRNYADLMREMNLAPRHLLEFRNTRPPVPVEQVEPVERILKRFSTAAMSHGALSVEAHETLAVAMNRLGGMSNSGEGGESKDRYFTERASRVKQVASGRFGVTPEYLMSADELQIKMAQGAKPGEGGQLPGHKVSAEIAILRHSTPGVALISPPPHHDIYSIEDLAQLIFDLKTINPNAKVSVKLVSQIGVGTIAAGVVKGFADVIHMSGANGGTGASPLSSVKNAGLPWEIGLAETHQVLLANGLRTRVTLRTDGGLATGRDVVMAAMLGADEYSFGTSAMIAEGCIMARVCHKNTCPVGVATQAPELRAKFDGTPEMVMRYMTHLAQDVRGILAELGYRSLDEIVGHPEMLEQVIYGREAGFMDLSPLLYVPDTGSARRNVLPRNEVIADSTVGDRIVEQVLAGLTANPDAPVRLAHPIRNTERTVGTRLSGQLALRYGDSGLPDGQVHVTFTGTAGQSFGAFGINGLNLTVIGEANDYVGKGLGGGEIVIKPAEEARFVPHANAILGNTALYGATGGRLFAAGMTGERFAVRNSGATAVVEGAGEHCCEYMTGGTVVVLGDTGRNFGAGMTGGQAFVYDVSHKFERRYNQELIAIRRLRGTGYEEQLRQLIEDHFQRTASPLAGQILEDWAVQRQFFWHVAPKENVVAIEAATEGSGEESADAEAVAS
ncbi:MAG: glutamate synthase large subunit [Caldilineaceae bacterium]|nr:glutamate synthase large subunit [Caldilineaceae bacterium]